MCTAYKMCLFNSDPTAAAATSTDCLPSSRHKKSYSSSSMVLRSCSLHLSVSNIPGPRDTKKKLIVSIKSHIYSEVSSLWSLPSRIYESTYLCCTPEHQEHRQAGEHSTDGGITSRWDVRARFQDGQKKTAAAGRCVPKRQRSPISNSIYPCLKRRTNDHASICTRTPRTFLCKQRRRSFREFVGSPTADSTSSSTLP